MNDDNLPENLNKSCQAKCKFISERVIATTIVSKIIFLMRITYLLWKNVILKNNEASDKQRGKSIIRKTCLEMQDEWEIYNLTGKE